MQRMILYPLIALVMLAITPSCSAQNVYWLQGSWHGKAYLPGSDASQYYELSLKIYSIKGNKFEGIISTLQPSDTSVRFDSRISGVVYDKYLIVDRNKILYVKDAKDSRWKISCNNCKPPHMVFSIENGKFFFRGEVKDCFKECNGISEFSKDITEFDSASKESVYALVNGAQKPEPVAAAFVQNTNPASTDNTASLTNESGPVTQRIPVLPTGTITLTAPNTDAALSQKVPGSLQKNSSQTMQENVSVIQRIPVLPAGTVALTENKTETHLTQKVPGSLDKTLSTTIKESELMAPRIPVLPAGTVALTQNKTEAHLTQKVPGPLDKTSSTTIKESEPVTQRISVLSAGTIALTENKRGMYLAQKVPVSLNKTLSTTIKESEPVTQRIPVLPAGTIVFVKHNKSAFVFPQKQISLKRRSPSLVIRKNTFVVKRIPVLPAGPIVLTKHNTVSRPAPKMPRLLAGRNPSLIIKENIQPLTKNKVPSSIDTISITGNNKNIASSKNGLPVLRDTVTLLPAGYAERKKNVIRTLTVNTDSIVLRVYDNGVVDGDIVSVVYNDEVVVDKLSLTARALVIKIPVKKEGVNTLVFHAHNLGDYPPNTAKLEIIYGNKKEELTVSSDFTVSSTIDIVHQEK